jgi:hypothetical protein
MPETDAPVIGTGPAGHARAGGGLTRREGLLALALLAPAGLLAACTGSADPAPSASTASARPVDLTAEIASEEAALVAAYDTALATAGDLGEEATAVLVMIRDQHAQHLASLGVPATPVPSSASTAPATASATVTGLIAAERDAARSRVRACVATDDPDLARLLAFIGASEASHVPALRDLRSAGA